MTLDGLRVRVPLPTGLLFVGLVFTTVLVTIAWSDGLRDAERSFLADANVVQDALGQELRTTDEVLSGISTLVSSSTRIDRDQFRVFAGEVIRRHPYLHTVAYVPRVLHEDRAAFEAGQRSQGFATFSVSRYQDQRYLPAARAAHYFPIYLQEPLEPINAVILGLDLLSDPVLAHAVNAAIDTGMPQMAANPPLGDPKRGVWLLRAVYAGKTPPADVTGRRMQVSGLVAVQVSANGLLAHLLGDRKLRAQLRLGTGDSSATTTPGPASAQMTFSVTSVLTLHNAPVSLTLSRPLQWRDVSIYPVVLALGIGGLVTVLLVVTGRSLALRTEEARQRTREIQRQVTEKTAELEYEKERAQVTLASIGDGVITTDADSNVAYINPIAETLTGWRAADARGLPLARVFNVVTEDDHSPAPHPVTPCLQDGLATSVHHHVLIGRLGSEIAIDHSAAPIRDREQRIIGAVLVFRDVSQARRLSQEIARQAREDALTGLLNRRVFEQRLDELLAGARQQGHEHALLYLDLDQFKIVNDACGHVAGDELLRQIAGVLKRDLRRADTVVRLGGDEFGVLLEQCPQERALELAGKILKDIQEFRFTWGERSFTVGVSIGLVPIRRESESASAIMSAADAACYAAKDNGRNRVQIYEVGNRELARRRVEMQWVTRLTRALEEDRFVLYRQCIMPLDDGDECEMQEVLLRLRDEDGQIVPPGAFIPAAERYSLMPSIDRWVIRNCLRWIADHRELLSPQSSYSINLSGQSLGDDGFLEFVAHQLHESQVPPHMVCLEITETAAVANLTNAVRFIETLKTLGCRFLLDDFGSGWSSFGYLKNLPIDFLKIDGGFVKDMVNDPLDHAMVNSINDIGHAMGIKTIAEFVENDAILERLRALGVDYAQGYGIAMPEPLTVDSAWPQQLA